jgi:hypothetical protein
LDLSKIKIDSAKINRGDWVGDLPHAGMEGLRLKVRGIASAAYREALAKRGRAVPRSERHRDGTLPVALSDRVAGEALCDAVLLDWDGLTEAGEPVAYDRDLALKLLTDPNFAPFRDAVVFAASIVAEEDSADEDKNLGNSEPPSPGGSNGAN